MPFSGFSTKSRGRKTFLLNCEEKMLQKQILTYLSRKKILKTSLRQSTRIDWYFHLKKKILMKIVIDIWGLFRPHSSTCHLSGHRLYFLSSILYTFKVYPFRGLLELWTIFLFFWVYVWENQVCKRQGRHLGKKRAFGLLGKKVSA